MEWSVSYNSPLGYCTILHSITTMGDYIGIQHWDKPRHVELSGQRLYVY